MDFTNDPNDRRRVDAEAQRNRDAEVARMRRQGTPFRTIAERLNVSLGCVQKSLRRTQKLTDAMASGRPDAVVAAVVDDSMDAENVQVPEDVERCNILEIERLRYYESDSPQRRALAAWTPSPAWQAAHPARPPRAPNGKVRDRNAGSWRENCDAAMSDDSGDGFDDW